MKFSTNAKFVLISFIAVMVLPLSAENVKNKQNQKNQQNNQQANTQHINEQKPKQQETKPDKEKEVQLMAISTLANMATAVVGIGTDPLNGVSVGEKIIRILSSFINFVSYAMKHPEVIDLIEEPEFREALTRAIDLENDKQEN